MKLLLVTERYWPEIGAAPSRLTNMSEGLKSEGVDIEILTCLPNYPKGKIFDNYRGHFSQNDSHNGINILRYWVYATVSKRPIKRIFNMFSFAITLWSFLFKKKRIRSYDKVIIQTPSLVVAASALTLFKKLYGKKCILNVSDLWPLTAFDMGAMTKECKSYKFMSILEKYLYKNADAVMCQSQESIDYISKIIPKQNYFLYRNLQRYSISNAKIKKHTPVKLVYAGLLGVAQNILELIENIDFKRINAELHIYGGGNQEECIKEYLKNKDLNIYYHGILDKKYMADELKKYDASIVPLATHITGAVPSKIFDLMLVGLPILFCGGGEGAYIINKYNLGLVSEPGDYNALSNNISKLNGMSEKEYFLLSQNCINASKGDFDFNSQITKCLHFIEQI